MVGVIAAAALASCCCSSAVWASGLGSTSRQVALGVNQYFVPPEQVSQFTNWKTLIGSLNLTDSNGDMAELLPLTVVSNNSSNVTSASVSATMDAFSNDDVWNSAFMDSMFFQTPDGVAMQVDPSAIQSDATILSNLNATLAKVLSQGPYLVSTATGKVYPVYRLYPDDQQAFLDSVYSDSTGTFNTVQASVFGPGSLSIAVPSRLYYTKTAAQPLAGVRVAVKDLFDLKGVSTTFGNRAYESLQKPATENAVAVQKLVDAGAVVVGKNKLSAFAWAGPYINDHIDYLLPFNPRGDGYELPGDSSGGSAAAIAMYGWLDLTLGSDTGGSIRGPAAFNGVYGNRPSTGAVNLTGAGTLSMSMDTAGLLARDPSDWAAGNEAMYNDTTQNYTAFPSKIWYPVSANDSDNYFLPGNKSFGHDPDFVYMNSVFDDFRAKLTSFLKGNVTEFHPPTLWQDHPGRNGTDVYILEQTVSLPCNFFPCLIGRPIPMFPCMNNITISALDFSKTMRMLTMVGNLLSPRQSLTNGEGFKRT